MAGVRVSLVAGSAAAGRAARDVVSALFVRVALACRSVSCVDVLQESESFKTRPGSMSDSPALARYDDFSDLSFH